MQDQRMAELLGERFKPDGPGAAVLVRQGGRVVHRAGYGEAHLELGVATLPEMIFRIGSLTKTITAAAILLLAEEEKLVLEDDFTRYLPKYPAPPKPITIEQLLTHTHGIPDHPPMPQLFWQNRRDLAPLQLLESFQNLTPYFAPGERWSYSAGSGYIVLGAIIEACSGTSYPRFVEERIFARLGMRHSSFDRAHRIVPGRVAGYTRGRQRVSNARFLSMTQAYAAGGLLSSVDDLALFDTALAKGELVSRDLLRRARTAFELTDGSALRTGLGCVLGLHRGQETVEHGGGIAGFSSYALRLIDDDAFICVLANDETAGAVNTALDLADLLRGFDPSVGVPRPHGKSGKSPDLTEAADSSAADSQRPGFYRAIDGATVEISLHEGVLRYDAPGYRLRLQREGDGTFSTDLFRSDVVHLAFVPGTAADEADRVPEALLVTGRAGAPTRYERQT